MQGLRDLLQQLRQMRRDQLDKYDLSSAIENINQTMENILELEKDTLNESINKTSTDNSLTDPDNAEFVLSRPQACARLFREEAGQREGLKPWRGCCGKRPAKEKP